jgi:hypothetical protein
VARRASRLSERVAVVLRCAECHDVWLPDDEERWRAYFDVNDKLVFRARLSLWWEYR